GEGPPGAEQLEDAASALGGIPALLEAEKENDPASAAARVTEAVKSCLSTDRGALASVDLGSDQGLERLSFQTSKMKSLFLKFPDSLLLHRVQGKRGHVLYMLIAETKERVGKVVHWSVLRNETGQRISRMLTAFKEFNPEWGKVKVVFMDVSFLHKAVLHELFPSAQVLLSVYHAVRLLEENVNAADVPSCDKNSMKLALKSAVFSTSAASVDALSQMVKSVVNPELYNYLQANWFSCELLWYMHAKKGLHSCSAHMDSLDLISQQAAALFGQQSSLEASVLRLLECADCFDSRPLESSNRAQSGCQEKPAAWAGAAGQPGPPPAPRAAAEHSEEDSEEGANQRAEERIRQSLGDICTEPAARLCLRELAVVQRSVQLMSSSVDAVSVQVLEDAHRVSQEALSSCTCHFNRALQLPCRHILAVLNSKRKTVLPEMLGRQWQRGCDFSLARQVCADPLLEDLESSWDESRDKSLAVSSLTAEIGRLLAHCSVEEFERRCSTLRALADSW
ncbi:ZSWM3 protein, partial [Alectura lathami]|nr:ZSWM3 protein [Alectura lathami]